MLIDSDIGIGSRVRLRDEYRVDPVSVVPAGLTGTVFAVSARGGVVDAVTVRFDLEVCGLVANMETFHGVEVDDYLEVTG